jgi:hypothetical protein
MTPMSSAIERDYFQYFHKRLNSSTRAYGSAGRHRVHRSDIVPKIEERRSFGRRDTCLTGWIWVRGRPRLYCKIRNCSAGGVFLECAPPEWLPIRFDLILEISGEVIHCEFRHYSRNGVGAAYCRPEAAEGDRPSYNRASLEGEADAWLASKRPSGLRRTLVK